MKVVKRRGAGDAGWTVLVALLWGGAFVLACRLEGDAAFHMPAGFTAWDRVWGISRRALSDSFYEEADNYFHQGVKHVRPRAFTNSWFVTMREVISPTAHRHASGIESREILPWLQWAVRSDPHNVNAYLVTAYYLSSALKRPDTAERVLIEAQMANPNDYRILMERARIALRQHDDEKATRLFDAAIRLWREEGITDSEEARSDLASMLSFRAFLHEIRGETDEALKKFKEAARWNPDDRALAERIAAMERGESFVEHDRALWENFMRGNDEDEEHERSIQCMRGGAH